jgi:hypothetical protein
MLSTHLRLGIPICLITSGSPTNNLYTFLFSPLRATCPAQLILLDFIILIIVAEKYQFRISSLCSFLHPPVTPSLFGPVLRIYTHIYIYTCTLIVIIGIMKNKSIINRQCN